MIAYDLKCANGHIFEGWFEDVQAFEEQSERGLIACPICSDVSVFRIPSTFAIKSSPSPQSGSKELLYLEKLGKKLIEYVEQNFDDVGSDFTKEALKMHYGITESRNIRGVSTEQEEKVLKDEGIQFFKIPMPRTPEDSDA